MASSLVFLCFIALPMVGCLLLFLLIRSIIRRASDPTRGRVWLPIFGLLLLHILLPLFYFHFPWGVRVFSIRAHSMAPSLLGSHWEVPCPECSETAFALDPPMPPHLKGRVPESFPVDVICPNFHRSKTPLPQKNPRMGDRIMMARFLNPRRWDLVVYHPPESRHVDPNDHFVMRLVGIPGEKLEIRDDRLLVDDVALDVPEHLLGLTYDRRWTEMPLVLGPDEFFVLGDRTESALDSRYHGPVQRDRILGVATMIYLPGSRIGGLPRGPADGG